MTTIAVVLSTTRQDRFSATAGRWATQQLSRFEVDIDLIDLRDHPLPFFDAAPPAYTGRNYPTPEVAAFARRIDAADGFIVLTAEYNHGYPAVLKNAMDHTFVEWQRKPMSFIGWGNVGGARAIEQLRLVAVEFEMAPLRHAVHILPDVMVAVRNSPADFDPDPFAGLESKMQKLVEDLLWWTGALGAARDRPAAG